jgi:predicted ribosomally synthesized peptide with nif11-like leader
MSVDKAKAFLIKLTEDDAAATKADDAYVRGLLELAGEMDYEVSENDMREALDELSGIASLSEEQLEQVAGGLSFSYRLRDSVGYFFGGFSTSGFTRG